MPGPLWLTSMMPEQDCLVGGFGQKRAAVHSPRAHALSTA
jgi:hypothetical protein